MRMIYTGYSNIVHCLTSIGLQFCRSLSLVYNLEVLMVDGEEFPHVVETVTAEERFDDAF